jgi:hypothetical protein
MVQVGSKTSSQSSASKSTKTKKILMLERGLVTPKRSGSKYCSSNSQSDLESASGLFPSTGKQIMSSTWPVQSDPTFNQKITLQLSGVTGKCSYVMKNGSKPTHSCDFPKGQITWNDLSPYQSLISSYIHPETPYRGILAYHGLGSGKTLVGISVMCNFLQKDPERTIVFLGKPSLKANFYKDLAKVDDSMLFSTPKTPEEREKILGQKMVYVTFEEMANRLCGSTAWNFGTWKGQTKEDSKEEPLFNNTLIIIDEAHNLVKQLSKPIYPDPDAAAVVLSAIRNSTNVRLVFLTATPIQQDAYEVGILLNLLIPSSSTTRFPETFVEATYQGHRFKKVDEVATKKAFDEMFIGSIGANGGAREIKNQDKIISITQGLVSYYPVDYNYSQFARAVYPPTIYVPMTDTMLAKWAEKRKEELIQSGDSVDLTCSLSSTDYAGDDEEDGASGATRKPKACASSLKASNSLANYRSEIGQWDMNQFNENAPKIPVVTKNVEERFQQGLGKQMIFVSTGDVTIFALTKFLEKQGWTFWDYETKVSSLLRKKYGERFSAEVQKDTWCQSGKGDALVELGLLKEETNKKGFVVLNGEINEAYKVKVLVQLFNSASNIDGSRINLIVLNTKYSEGLSLMATTAVHILEPPRSMALLSQITARAIRMCSHVGLTYPERWNVHVFRYMIQRDDVFKTIDPLTFTSSGQNSSSSSSKSNSYFTNFAQLAKKDTGGDVSLFMESGSLPSMRGQGKSKFSVRRGGGSEEGTGTKKSNKNIQFLQSKCDMLTSEVDCNKKDYCAYDADLRQCKLLGTESSIFKVARIKGDELESFLTLLRIASVDCAIFKSMHDPSKPVSCHLPIGSSSSGTELSPKSRIVFDLSLESAKNDVSTDRSSSITSECAAQTNEETCTASSKCKIHGKNCVPNCELLKNGSMCEKEPMCRYEKSYFSSSCSPRFPLELLEKENSFGFSTQPHKDNLFLKEVTVVDMEISQVQQASSDFLMNFLQNTEKLSPINLMRRLQRFLEMEGYMPITELVDKLIEIVKKRIQNPIVTKGFLIGTRENWRDTSMIRVTTNVMRLMTMRKRDVMAFPSAYLLKTSFDPLLLLKKGVSELHFVLHLNIEDSEYFISSKEVKGLGVNMEKLTHSKQILKEFVYADLSLYMVFSYSASPLQVDMYATVVKRTDVYEAFGELPVVNAHIPRVFTRVVIGSSGGGGIVTKKKISRKEKLEKTKKLLTMRSY